MKRKDFLKEFKAKRPVKMYYVYNYKVCSCNVKDYIEHQRTDEFGKSETFEYVFKVDGCIMKVKQFPKSCLTSGGTAYYWKESDAEKDRKEEIEDAISDLKAEIKEAEEDIESNRLWDIQRKKDIAGFKKEIAKLKKLL